MGSVSLLAPNPTESTRHEAAMHDELDRILRRQLLMPLFMPIVNSRERGILGYEALIRGPAGSPLHTPISLFKTAQRAGRLLELELLCRETSIRRFKYLDLRGKLFLNVTPATLLESDFQSGMTLDLMQRVGFDADRLVIEITEQFPIEDYELMKEATCHYRELGFEVALDDLGAGYSGLRSWSELRPQYVKIDRHFIEGIDGTPIKQEFVRSIQEVARSIQCQVIAEGIERIEEHHTLNSLGLVLQQGYYFSRPTPLPPKLLDEQLFRFSQGRQSNPVRQLRQELTAITRIRPPIDRRLTLGEASKIFRQHPELRSLAVVEDDRPVGLLNRDTFLGLYLNPFGRELHDRKPVTEFMDPSPLVLEEQTALTQVSQKISESDASAARSDFIVTSQGKYLGMGALFDLLKLITDLQLRNARHANPLTLLPGSVPASEEISRRLQREEGFALCYLDIDNFKAFNDAYGYERGDQMIRLLADCLKTLLDDSRDFLSHIGGDDFLAVFGSPDWQARCARIQQEFGRRAPQLYNDADRRRGGIQSESRSGDTMFFALASLSIGAALPDLSRCHSHHDIAALASDAKRIAKQRPGNSFFINRRQAPDRTADGGPTEAAAAS